MYEIPVVDGTEEEIEDNDNGRVTPKLLDYATDESPLPSPPPTPRSQRTPVETETRKKNGKKENASSRDQYKSFTRTVHDMVNYYKRYGTTGAKSHADDLAEFFARFVNVD